MSEKEIELSPEAQSCCDDIVRAMQQANQYLERGDYATAGCYQGFVIGYLCGLNQFGHTTDYEVLDNGFYGKLICDGKVFDFTSNWKYKETVSRQ